MGFENVPSMLSLVDTSTSAISLGSYGQPWAVVNADRMVVHGQEVVTMPVLDARLREAELGHAVGAFLGTMIALIVWHALKGAVARARLRAWLARQSNDVTGPYREGLANAMRKPPQSKPAAVRVKTRTVCPRCNTLEHDWEDCPTRPAPTSIPGSPTLCSE